MASTRKSLLNRMMKHRKRLEDMPMRVQFALDPNRFKRFSVQAGDILLDYSKNRIDEKVMETLFDIARDADVEGRPGDAAFDRAMEELGFHSKWVRVLGTYRQARRRG